MAKAPNWTTTELELLVSEYPKLGKSKAILALFPGRTLEGIALKANRLGLRVTNNIRKARDNSWYLEQIESTNFVPLEPYRGSTVPILHMCGTCDYEWLARPQHILRVGAKCPVCSLEARKTSVAEVDKVLLKQNLLRISEYAGAFEPLEVKHTTCGHTYTTRYSYIQQGSGCPVCNKGWAYLPKESLPERATTYLLKVTVDGVTFLKAGVTTRPIRRRVSELKSNILKVKHNVPITIEVLMEVDSTAVQALTIEHKILNGANISKYYCNGYSFPGSTELIEYSSLEAAINIFNQAKK